MGLISTLSTGAVAGLHGYIMVLEMFLWTTPRGRKAFGLTADYAEKTKTLAANQGLYNGFLAAGLAWSLAHPDNEVAKQLRVFFLGCVAVAGGYGGATVKPKILFIQTVPAFISLGALWLDL